MEISRYVSSFIYLEFPSDYKFGLNLETSSLYRIKI